MAETTIEWADYTFNPWRGCTKVSEGCKFCYAELKSKRNPAVLGQWGPQGQRVIGAESYWQQPIAWNKQAEREGSRKLVFCASLADIFEGPDTMPPGSIDAVEEARLRLFELISVTPRLDWLLLTKRPQNALAFIDDACWPNTGCPMFGAGKFWDNIWIGISVENQQTADERIPILAQIPAKVRFLSCEPLLGAIDIEKHLFLLECSDPKSQTWVIVGGESGANARPMHPSWVRFLRDQCINADVPFFFKQWGQWRPVLDESPILSVSGRTTKKVISLYVSSDGSTSPMRLGPRKGSCLMEMVGKKKAGRLLDGWIWEQVPGGISL